MVFKSFRDGEAFLKLAYLRDDEAFLKIHLWRWIHGHHQVIISGAFLQRRCSIFQRFISGDGNVVLVPSSLLLIRDMVNVFLIIASPSL